MSVKLQRSVLRTTGLLFLFALYTLLISIVDVRAIGPQGSSVGFAWLNGLFQRESVSMFWYRLTTLLGYLSLLIAAGFAVLAAAQFLRTRSLKKVNVRLILLCIFYVLVLASYVLFEILVVNYRPVLLEGALEASYPSSHTMLGICILGSAMLQLRYLLKDERQLLYGEIGSTLLLVLMVIGRLLSGVHWFTDILGAVLLSAALLSVYCTMLDAAAALGMKTKKRIPLNFQLRA